MTALSFDLPDDVLCTFAQSPEEFVRAMRLAAALHWYQRGEISQGLAVEVAGLNRADFMDALTAAGIETFVVDIDDLRRELARG